MCLKVCLRHGERQPMWLNKLKVAVVQKDVKLLGALLEDIPSLETPEEIENARYLLQEATKLVQSLQDNTFASMKQIKKNIAFLNSGIADSPAKFDITS